MGFWEKLFGKKKERLGESDGQEEYFKEDFAPVAKKPATKKADGEPKSVAKEPIKPAKAEKPAAKAEKQTVKAAPKTEKSASKVAKPQPKKQESKAFELGDDSPEVKGAVAVKESKATANGKFDIRKAKDGRFFFSLYASNGAVIAYSQIYSSVSAVTTGINSVINNATKSDIEDTTLKKPVSLPCPKWEIYIDKAEQYRFRLYATNGLCICHSSHGYATKSGCKGGIDSIRRFAAEARVDKSYLK